MQQEDMHMITVLIRNHNRFMNNEPCHCRCTVQRLTPVTRPTICLSAASNLSSGLTAQPPADYVRISQDVMAVRATWWSPVL